MSITKNDVARFPAWGPYSKKYMGISHLPQHERRAGVRFDFSTVPALSHLDIHLPNVTLPTGWRAWSAAPDLSVYSYRVDLQGLDDVYGEVFYGRLDDHTILVRTELTNHTDLIQDLMINYFSSIEYPQIQYTDVQIPKGGILLDALDYADFAYASPRPWDRQNCDGHKLGEVVYPRFTGGHGLGDGANKWHLPQLQFGAFGAEQGDRVSYRFVLDAPVDHAVLWIRYQSHNIEYDTARPIEEVAHMATPSEDAVFIVNDTLQMRFPCTLEPALCSLSLGDLAEGVHELDFVSQGAGGLALDFLAILPEGGIPSVLETKPVYEPSITESVDAHGASISLAYPDVQETYHLRTFDTDTRFRRIRTGSLEDAMSSRLSNPDPTFDDVLAPFTRSFQRKHSDDGFFHDTLVHTIFVDPGCTKTIYAVLSDRPVSYEDPSWYETWFQMHRPQTPALTKAGMPYAFSVGLLQSALLTNIVFPIYKDQHYILHHTPGKRWDSLYTWDSGFIGLGMLDLAPAMADYSLDTYTYAPDHTDAAFLHHGSPVPVQMYLFYEMLQKASDKDALLEQYYPRMRYYYEFLAGRTNGSTTARYKSGLTSTYDYFYSSSGMDDYPPQVHMIADGLQRKAAPVISTSQVIRSAKILKACAETLGYKEDVAEYTDDIERLTSALNWYSWDPETGYFSYVLHDEEARPTGIYRTSEGENLNKGLDGIYPLIAGILDPDQEKVILHHLTDPKEMLSPYGISAVDQSAGYFMVNGYWNGNVWFAHQWFIWKSMLDLGQTEFAHTIAKLALDVWKREVDATHYTFEMVSVVTGRGGWFHNFGGLSAPISLWANAYFKPGTINAGFDTWIDRADWNADHTALKLLYRKNSGAHEASAILIVMDDAHSYDVLIDGAPASCYERCPGTLEIRTDRTDHELHSLTITKK